MSKISKTELRRMGTEIKSSIHIGKGGISENLIEEIRNQLKKHKIVKIRILESAGLERMTAAKELADRTQTKLVEVRGNTILLCEASLFEQTE
ncbi:MAG: YhbY family RNA-binding protein [Methanomassiliicoccales archaeon]|nr:YhbY family RNA-binding protein [Methanomassiliicoccales archaeon]